MERWRLAVAMSVAISASACSFVLPVTLAKRADDHNRRAEVEAARTGRPADRQSVGARALGGFLGGVVIDGLLVTGVFFIALSTSSTH